MDAYGWRVEIHNHGNKGKTLRVYRRDKRGIAVEDIEVEAGVLPALYDWLVHREKGA